MTHVNEKGVKWTLNDGLTKWATEPDINGTRLSSLKAWDVEEPNGNRTRLLTNDDGEILCDSPLAEAIAVKIDLLKFLKRTEKC